MALPDSTGAMSPAAYLTFDRQSDVRHEYIDGQAVAMAGASRRHNLIAQNISSYLHYQLKGRPCEAYQSDMRVMIQAPLTYAYPDVSAACDPHFADTNNDILLNPVLLIEVLSTSTEAYDRGNKFRAYRRIESLQHYLLVSQDSVYVEHYTPGDNGLWQLAEFNQPEDTIHLNGLSVRLPLSDIYDEINLENSAE
jgi:Uma2 family endonuclease